MRYSFRRGSPLTEGLSLPLYKRLQFREVCKVLHGAESGMLMVNAWVVDPKYLECLHIKMRWHSGVNARMRYLWISAVAVSLFIIPRISLLSRNNSVGNGIRKIVADGFPINGVLGFDIEKGAVLCHWMIPVVHCTIGFWNLGHETFRSTPETFPVAFVEGDAFDPSILEPVSPFNDVPKTPRPALSSLTSLNPLRGHVSVIHAAAFFHMFNEERQVKLARALAGLLSFEPGSVIFGSHIGNSVKRFYESSHGSMFQHSPDSWKELWDGQIFEKRKVRVAAALQAFPRVSAGDQVLLVWSITRL